MQDEPSTTEFIDQLLADAADENTSTILLALSKLSRSIDGLRLETVALRSQLEQITAGTTDHSPTAASPAPQTAPAPQTVDPRRSWLQPAAFCSTFSEYEAGVLFEHDVGFDVTLTFSDARSWERYRARGFADAGHVLHVLLEACARSECSADADLFTYRRDIHSATVYATERPPLERLLSRFLELSGSDEGTLKLIERMNQDLE